MNNRNAIRGQKSFIVDQPVRRFGRRRAVERHHRRGDPGAPPQLGTPPVAGIGDFDHEGTFADEFFEAMNGHCVGWVNQVERSILRGCRE